MQESRVYTHQRCGTQTMVDGPEFRAMSDPLAGMKTTYCVQCADHFSVSEFVWTDTNELISDYYARYRKNASASDLWWCGNVGLALLVAFGLLAGIACGIALGMITSVLIGSVAGVVLALAGAIVGALMRENVIAHRISERVCGVADTRALR